MSLSLPTHRPLMPRLPSYNGIEVDMLNIGDADCILVTGWVHGAPERVLIDGGSKKNAETVRQFLRQRAVRYVDHVVSSHPHNDHAGGLLELVRDPSFDFGSFWMHVPGNHIDIRLVTNALQKTPAKRVAKIIDDSLELQREIGSAVERRRRPVYEPFVGNQIGFLTVCGPTRPFYGLLVAEFANLERLARFEDQLTAYERQSLLEMIVKTHHPGADDGSVLGGQPTAPENDTSVILATRFSTDVLLFTADAGVIALTQAARAYPQLRNCDWMQIPHHGSRRNINEELIRWFSPRMAYVSAGGNLKHPRRKVVNTFKQCGTRVFSTHHPRPAHLWYGLGSVPRRLDYGPAAPLYDQL